MVRIVKSKYMQTDSVEVIDSQKKRIFWTIKCDTVKCSILKSHAQYNDVGKHEIFVTYFLCPAGFSLNTWGINLIIYFGMWVCVF